MLRVVEAFGAGINYWHLRIVTSLCRKVVLGAVLSACHSRLFVVFRLRPHLTADTGCGSYNLSQFFVIILTLDLSVMARESYVVL